MLTKTLKTKLQKICLVLFPKYKYIKIDTIHNEIKLSNYKCFLIRWFMPKLVLSIDELIQYRIPVQLADFLYGNTSFVSVIQEELVRCELSKRNKIDYFYEEICKVKFADIYKQIKIEPNIAYTESATYIEDEKYDEMWNEMIRYEQGRVRENRVVRFFKVIAKIDRETIFYTFLALAVLYSILY